MLAKLTNSITNTLNLQWRVLTTFFDLSVSFRVDLDAGPYMLAVPEA